MDDSELRRFATLFNKISHFGTIHNTQQFKKIDGKIWEFKRNQARIGCFQVGDRWRLTHGFIKKRKDWPKRQIDMAKKIMEEDLKRDQVTRTRGRKRKR